MMLLISYDLRNPDRDYSSLYLEIKKAPLWWHYLDSTWIISTNLEPTHWQKQLCQHLDDKDSLLVIEIRKNYQGWLPKRAWEWLNKRNFSG